MAGAGPTDRRDRTPGKCSSAKLREEVLSERYRPGDVKRVWIPKPGGGQRGLGIPNVVDRWV